MNAVADIRMDKETFYRWVERQERRHELVNGRPVMMNGVTFDHARIARNLCGLLMRLVDPNRHDLLVGEVAVEIGDTIRYPDIMVCERESDGKAQRSQSPILLIEILSETSLYIDLHDKAAEYTSLPSVGTYAVFSQDSAKAWVWTRGNEGMPAKPEEVFCIEKALEVPSLGLSLPFEDIYRGVELRE
jgi:Uma2 family endonuclease